VWLYQCPYLSAPNGMLPSSITQLTVTTASPCADLLDVLRVGYMLPPKLLSEPPAVLLPIPKPVTPGVACVGASCIPLRNVPIPQAHPH
jgi:hypothetical protein